MMLKLRQGRRPWILPAVAAALVLVALSFPVQIAMVYGHPVSELLSVLNKISVVNWVVIGFCLLNAWLIRDAAPACRLTAPLSIAAVALNNWTVGRFDGQASLAALTISAFGFALLFVPLLHPHIRHLLHAPHKRTWLQSARIFVNAPVELEMCASETWQASLWDLSTTGAFIPFGASERSADKDSSDQWSRVHVGTEVTLSLPAAVSEHAPISLQGRVVRREERAKGTYPAGFGVKFEGMGRETLRHLTVLQQQFALVSPT